jgi:hypothetical protein
MMDLAERRASKSVHAAALYNAERWDKTHKDHDFKVGELVLISMVNFENLGGNKKLNGHFVGPFVIKAFHGRNAVEVVLTEGFDLKHPTFPVSLVKRYVSDTQIREDVNTPVATPPPKGMEAEGKYPIKILDEKIVRITGKDTRLYLTRFKNSTPDDDNWLRREDISQANKLLRSFCATNRKTHPSGIRAVLIRGGKCQENGIATLH